MISISCILLHHTYIINISSTYIDQMTTAKQLDDVDLGNWVLGVQSGDFSTYKKHGMDYFTEQGVLLRTGFDEKREWYLLCIRELLDNAVDFLTKYYKGANDTVITTVISRDEKSFHIKVQIQIIRIYLYCKIRKLYLIMICVTVQNNICI